MLRIFRGGKIAGIMSSIPGRAVALIAAAACGFGVGIGLLLGAEPRFIWFVSSLPGGWLFSPFASLGAPVWMVPVGNGIAYAVAAVLLMCLFALTKRFKARAV
jgi:hypothetical protein